MWTLLKIAASFLFGGKGKAEESVGFVQESIKGVGNFIDEQQLTGQEKAELNLESGKLVLKAIELSRDENTTRSVTRRVLAWAIFAEFLFLLNMALITRLFDKEYSDFVLKLMTDYWIGELTFAVGSFYFLANVVRARKQ